MIEIKCSVEYLAREISYSDFLELCYRVQQNLNKDSIYPDSRFIYDITKELSNRPIKEIVFSNDIMDNLIICFSDTLKPMIADACNIFTNEQLRILRVAGVVEADSYKLTEDGIELMYQHQDTTSSNTTLYNYYKIQSNIFEWYCVNI